MEAIDPQKFQSIPLNQAKARAVQNVGLYAASHLPFESVKPTYSVELDTDGVTEQKHSGRCWLFAQLNVLRHVAGARLKFKNLEFSESYLAFYDRLEKANHFLTQMIAMADRSLDDRELAFILSRPDNDGGQFDNAVALIQKYGLVPKSAMPETFTSSNTADFNRVLNRKLRQLAVQLRAADSTQRETIKQAGMSDVYRLLSYAYGTVPTTFDFEYCDDDNHYHRLADLTPQSFYQQVVNIELEQQVTLLSRQDLKYWQTYRLPAEDNVEAGHQVLLVNVPFDVMSQLAITQLQAGQPVLFGNDVLQDLDRATGTLKGELYQLSDLLECDCTLDQGARFETKAANLSHAMTLVGVDLVDDAPRRWKVENSWGSQVGHLGYFNADAQWMQQYAYEMVILKEFLPEKIQQALMTTPIALKAWDPLG
ncbi:aminopeptidase C [Lacticaseibacillus porcinae]|uniref:aminopeptidase C n=1 Tax=Lacticaseibacillus porcinae TaxID=1123687 RepID=UPI000F7A465C|nr:C1 family peptidase [Lacticaseibacillus porcinae]